jgi:hypothetical protein
MQNAFAFDWVVDFLSQGTANLYRKYMAGAVVAVEEHMWHHLGSGGTCDEPPSLNFDKFDEAYPDLAPTERLRFRGCWPETSTGDHYNDGGNQV